MKCNEKRRGHYLGTEVDGKWWRRYRRHGLFLRGVGEYWFDGSTMSFRRYLTKTPIVIPLKDVKDIRVGRWHSGRWAGGAPVVKIFWNKEGNLVCSGFVLSRDTSETDSLVQEIRSLAANQTGNCAQ